MTFADWLIARVTRRAPDFIIGGADRPYIRRWWVIPRNRFFNVYLHQFLRSDDDRALHDHPWANVSIILRGRYLEHVPNGEARERRAGNVVVRLSGRMAHRVELMPGLYDMPGDLFPRAIRTCWTLFITGPRYREWGFHCQHGWVHWERFVATDDIGNVGRGCDQ